MLRVFLFVGRTENSSQILRKERKKKMRNSKNHRRVLFALILALSMMLSQVSAFADTAEVPMLLTVEPTPLDFTVTERIDMSVYQGETALNMNSVTVTNTGTEDLKVSSIAINPASGWSLEASSTDFATASKTALGFTCNSHDFSTGAYAPGDKLAVGSNLTYTLSGQISAKADLMGATQVASMVVTVEKFIISFTIDGRSYQTENGMTLDEWAHSKYVANGTFEGGATWDGPYNEWVTYEPLCLVYVENDGSGYEIITNSTSLAYGISEEGALKYALASGRFYNQDFSSYGLASNGYAAEGDACSYLMFYDGSSPALAETIITDGMALTIKVEVD